MSNVELKKVEGHLVHIGEHDLLSGTPILDIKPYIPKFDAFPQERAGWFEEMERELAKAPIFQVEFDTEARRNLDALGEPALEQRILDVLTVDPLPHRTRRIIEYRQGYRLSCGDFRVFYCVHGETVTVRNVRLRD
jgi:mRNA-degrading endonuclease RelE of RelBE toxin-antitoxin system